MIRSKLFATFIIHVNPLMAIGNYSFSFAVRETASLGQQMLNAPLGIDGLNPLPGPSVITTKESLLIEYDCVILGFSKMHH